MGFPDRIERTVPIAHPPEKVWAALTTAEGLDAWFGNEATIDLRPSRPSPSRSSRHWPTRPGGPSWLLWSATGTARSTR